MQNVVGRLARRALTWMAVALLAVIAGCGAIGRDPTEKMSADQL